MAFTEFYTQSGGSNHNAGSTNNNAAFQTYESGDWTAATGVFSTLAISRDPQSDGVTPGMFASVYVDGAAVTGFAGRITAVSATSITVSLTAKAGTAPTDGVGTRTLKVGGAWQGPNATEAFPFGFVQSTLTNVAGETPRVNLKNDAAYVISVGISHANPGPLRFQGYTASAGDGGRAVIDGGANTIALLTTTNANGCEWFHFSLQNNGATGSNPGVISGQQQHWFGCVAHDLRGAGFISENACLWEECEAYACNTSNSANTAGFTSSSNGAHDSFMRCIAHDNAGSNADGFIATRTGSGGSTTFQACVADTNGRHGFNLNWSGGASVTGGLVQCDSYNNAMDGIRFNGGTSGARYRMFAQNCNLVKNGGYGIRGAGSGVLIGRVLNCGFGGGGDANAGGQTTSLGNVEVAGSVSYTSHPWFAPHTGDFRISHAEAQGAGRGTFTQTQAGYSGTVGYPDLGAAAHQDAGGAGGIKRHPGMAGGLIA